MPNPWTGKGNPYTKQEVRDRLQATIDQGKAIIAAGAGTGISAKFIEKGGADLIIIYNSGRFRMAGHGSTAGLMAYGDANAVAMEIGEFEVLPVVEEIPVICGVHGSDPRRRMWHHLLKVKEMGFSGVNNFPTHSIVDGHFRQVLEETGMGFAKEVEMVRLATMMDLFSIVYVATPEEARQMAEVGADAIIAHVGTTVGGSIGVVDATCSMDEAIERTQRIGDAAREVNPNVFVLAHGGPVNTPADVREVLSKSDIHGFVGASSLERMGVEQSLTELTRDFKRLTLG
ncbi:putative TIM-barrel enzyme [Dyadobacter sp. BE34]|uniref:TIM-barrel enzyme n=1 Tax=Dyadobacter fermentans TaxID=94254 RepID=A0ABU1QVE1_9BACT|nr:MULTISPECIES: phosphoenolpyruvate hydrolase family protein [Dyadobacter]MDR6805111.1 putative TIM-barrel enzyme [Dyadobacter fermentans]MDR7043130.1 putative TIM-barrel enzyme [Dyadobacter sp. BE242]MDR7197442.1 putative TIM-barrel enzyme [Dyadobacter sp. BE34]MDR7215125.1 putative TIM-barrel enzyme [Dyadobacter sp. BE31]MDR7262660.1 putative TIM-barrel enzyme [Dyadobacter sp. BE32]